MSKIRINPAKTLPPIIDKATFNAAEILSAEKVDKAISALTGQLPRQTPEPPLKVEKVETEIKRKKETAKGTVVVSAMVQKELMRTLRIYAATHDSTMSDVINRALTAFFDAETIQGKM
jgi:hypothetical protein